MKAFKIFYEPINNLQSVGETVLIAAENEGKARLYFRSVYEGRILKVKAIKQV
ncbi:hypothetical protein ACVWYG_002568 [Pedobacter sp. UYEF25]